LRLRGAAERSSHSEDGDRRRQCAGRRELALAIRPGPREPISHACHFVATIVKPSPLERFLRLFANVEAREGVTSVILVLNIFLILMAYYFIKPVREGWLSVSVFRGLSQLEVKAYSAFGQSLLLLAILPLYAKLAALWTRRDLVLRVGAGFGVLLVVFWLLQPGLLWENVPYAGLFFYMYVGVFSVTLVAQFWSFASDLYGAERGRRLFPLVAIGASAGGAVGAWAGERLLALERVQAFDLILLALLPLGLALALAVWSDRRGTYGAPSAWTTTRWRQPAAPSNAGAYQLILQHRYLMATALMVTVFSWVVASGDNILFGLVQESVQADLDAAGVTGEERSQRVNAATTAFYGDLYFWINIVGLLLQAFIVSRILRYGGFMALMLATPLISFAAYLSMAVAPVIGIIKTMKVVENSSVYSVNNTARHMLWLPVTKEMLYQAKTAIDTLFFRLGDGLAALTVLVGTRVVRLDMTGFLLINLGLVVVWIALSIYLVRENRRWRQRALSPNADSI
jgi:AAA family ATP:ADP antiporter